MAGARRPQALRPLVIADAGPLIALAKAGSLGLAKRLFGSVRVTAQVEAELGIGSDMPGAQDLQSALGAGWLVRLEVPAQAGEHPFLGPGEASALASAQANPGALLLIDERLARREAARCGVAMVGTAGLLCAAKENGWIKAVAPLLTRMREQGYFLGDAVINAARARAGEN